MHTRSAVKIRILTILVNLSHDGEIDARVRTWDSLHTLNFVKIAQGVSSLRSNPPPKKKNLNFREFELLKPTFLYL